MKMYNTLAQEGALMVNVISSIEGEKGKFFRAEYATIRSVFPQVYVFGVMYPDDGSVLQNFMVVALKSSKRPPFYSKNRVLNEFLQHIWIGEIPEDMPILTDDFSPIEKYIHVLYADPITRYNPIEKGIKSFIREKWFKKRTRHERTSM